MSEMNNNVNQSCRQLNGFLRGEISATETYKMAIGGSENPETQPSNLGLLREIQEEHDRAVGAVRDRILELGQDPADSSGGWGAWAKLTQGAAHLFGNAGGLKSLKEGEEHGLKDYQSGLNDLDQTSADLIRNQLIPAQQRHIELLNQLIDAST